MKARQTLIVPTMLVGGGTKLQAFFSTHSNRKLFSPSHSHTHIHTNTHNTHNTHKHTCTKTQSDNQKRHHQQPPHFFRKFFCQLVLIHVLIHVYNSLCLFCLLLKYIKVHRGIGIGNWQLATFIPNFAIDFKFFETFFFLFYANKQMELDYWRGFQQHKFVLKDF